MYKAQYLFLGFIIIFINIDFIQPLFSFMISASEGAREDQLRTLKFLESCY